MGLDAYSSTRENFLLNSFPLPQRKPSLVLELACTIRSMVNAIHRSVPSHAPHIDKTIPSWNRRLLAETALRRNLFLQKANWFLAWNCWQAIATITIWCCTLSRKISLDCLPCLFNTLRGVISHTVVSSTVVSSTVEGSTVEGSTVNSSTVSTPFVFKRLNRFVRFFNPWPLFCQSRMGAGRHPAARWNERAGCCRVDVVVGSMRFFGNTMRCFCNSSRRASACERAGDR